MRMGPSAVVSVSPQLVFAVNFLLVTRIRIMPHPRIPVLEALLHRGDSGAEIIDQELVQGGQHVGSQLTIEYPTVFHMYDVAQLYGDSPDQIQCKLQTAARTQLHAMKIQPPSRIPVNAHARGGASDIVKYWHALTGRGTETQSDSHHAGIMCAPQLWCKSAAELFHEARGQLEACEYLPTLLAPVVKLPRYLNAIMRMLLNKQALESHGIFRLAAANDAAAMNRWFDWIERNNNNNNNVPEYGAIPNLSPLDFAVLLKRWMSSLGDDDRLVPTACSRGIHGSDFAPPSYL
ncbi:hypothetical protein BCR44DRAFT_1462364 [Catenaria anguillulae PL171]|uniref:Uncharacterized protein n=1 Tax=Catenaria anguillulae PL171 TaxID=765915 RepID=A0A1Y2HGE5_9FUNG|nr:hypothetical protein BCR44DRAFT_1462364 [Catenaria anguillulae PL171]